MMTGGDESSTLFFLCPSVFDIKLPPHQSSSHQFPLPNSFEENERDGFGFEDFAQGGRAQYSRDKCFALC